MSDRMPANAPAPVRQRLEDLLEKTSRTFALTIPLLPEPTRHEVMIAYLLFRVADTLEDATLWPRERKLEELERFARLLARPSAVSAIRLAAVWTGDPPLSHEGYRELLGELPLLTDAAVGLRPEAWGQIARHTARTSRAMASFVARETDGVLSLSDVADLKAYCYAVAGIVGEMLTELFLLARDGLSPIASLLRRDAATFGEALQLVNILKDAGTDHAEGREFLPKQVSRTAVFDLAREDLSVAARYCGRLEQAGAERELLAFTALPVALARATLDCVEHGEPGAKLSRAEVQQILQGLQESLERRTVAAFAAAGLNAAP